MDKRPFIDNSILVPIGISVFSIVGILTIMLFVYLDPPQTVAVTDPTATPFKYILLATETLFPDLAVSSAEGTDSDEETFSEESTETDPFPTEPPQEEFGAFPPVPTAAAPTQSSFQSGFPTDTPLPNPTTALTATLTSTVALNVIDRYDDADPRLEYDGDWVGQTNVSGAHQRTLFVSSSIGSDVILSFEGQQIVVGYLGAPGLGSVSISIDDDEFLLNQSAGKEWVSPQYEDDEHFVIIVHETGDSINLDYINIIGSN